MTLDVRFHVRSHVRFHITHFSRHDITHDITHDEFDDDITRDITRDECDDDITHDHSVRAITHRVLLISPGQSPRFLTHFANGIFSRQMRAY